MVTHVSPVLFLVLLKKAVACDCHKLHRHRIRSMPPVEADVQTIILAGGSFSNSSTLCYSLIAGETYFSLVFSLISSSWALNRLQLFFSIIFFLIPICVCLATFEACDYRYRLVLQIIPYFILPALACLLYL